MRSNYHHVDNDPKYVFATLEIKYNLFCCGAKGVQTFWPRAENLGNIYKKCGAVIHVSQRMIPNAYADLQRLTNYFGHPSDPSFHHWATSPVDPSGLSISSGHKVHHKHRKKLFLKKKKTATVKCRKNDFQLFCLLIAGALCCHQCWCSLSFRVYLSIRVISKSKVTWQPGGLRCCSWPAIPLVQFWPRSGPSLSPHFGSSPYHQLSNKSIKCSIKMPQKERHIKI